MEIEAITYPDLNSLAHWLPFVDENGVLRQPRITIGERILNKTIYLERKRDGSNVGVYLDGGGNVQVRTRNQIYAQEGIRERLLKVPRAENVVQALKDAEACRVDFVFFGEWCAKGTSPARFETREKDEFQVFDIWNDTLKQWMPYPEKEATCKKYDIDLVELIYKMEASETKTLEGVLAMRDKIIAQLKEKGGEGIACKVYLGPYINFYKEKVPEKPKKVRELYKGTDNKPELPDSEIMGAIDKAYMDLPREQFYNPAYAMPEIAKLIAVECEKHGCKCTQRAHVFYKQKLEDLAKGS
jgi:hypothetical protein